jgi:hypothetical protein
MTGFELDLYLLGSFTFGVVMSSITAVITSRILKQAPESSYVEFNITAAELRDTAVEAIREGCHTLVLPPVVINGNQNKVLHVAFIDQRLRLEMSYSLPNTEEDYDDDDDDYYDGITMQ